MLSIFLAAAVAVPPPVEGDDRTAILWSVNRLLELIGTGEGDKFAEVVDSNGRMVIVDTTGGELKHIERPMSVLGDMKPGQENLAEAIGIPTVLQRGSLAQVWAPYTFWIDGKVSHCGIDNFTLVERGESWVVTDLSYTKEPPSACAALGAPKEQR